MKPDKNNSQFLTIFHWTYFYKKLLVKSKENRQLNSSSNSCIPWKQQNKFRNFVMTIRHYCPSILVEVPRSVYWNFSTPTHLDRKLNSDRRSRYFESLKRDSSPEKFHFFRPFCWVRIDVRNLDIPFKLSLWPAERAFVPAYFLERVRPFNRKGTIT